MQGRNDMVRIQVQVDIPNGKMEELYKLAEDYNMSIKEVIRNLVQILIDSDPELGGVVTEVKTEADWI